MDNNSTKEKKPMWFTLLIVVLAVCIFVIAAAIIYNSFFKSAIENEKTMELAAKQMSEKLQENQEKVKVYRKANNEIIEKYALDIYGRYTCTFNEVDKSMENEEDGNLYTKEVTTIMEINDDSTAKFNDGTTGWWLLKETDDGVVHMGLILPKEKKPQIYMVCDGVLVDESKACFFGEVPDTNTFDAEFNTQGFTLEFEKDGTVDGLYTEMKVENGVEYPYKEAYSGKYRRSGNYLDIMLNNSPARYYIFENSIAKTDKKLTGLASRYYVKN